MLYFHLNHVGYKECLGYTQGSGSFHFHLNHVGYKGRLHRWNWAQCRPFI